MKEYKKESVVNQIYDLLKEQIITIRMVPGQLLLVQQLAIDLGVSRTPVREALIRLKEEGLVNEAGGHKFRVSDVTWEMIETCYESREIIEVGCIKIAAEKAKKKDIDKLQEIIEKMKEAANNQKFPIYFELDGLFHTTIVDILNNSIMSDIIRKNSNQQQRIRYCSRGVSANIEKSLEEHNLIFNAIADGDSARAAELMKNHLSRSRDDLNSLREEQNIIPLILIK